jgi:hypothetical protein
MTIGSPRPWITLVLAVILILNPVGLDVIYAAFFSSEALSRNIWQPIVLIGLAILSLIGVLEWRIRVSCLKRRGGGSTRI